MKKVFCFACALVLIFTGTHLRKMLLSSMTRLLRMGAA